MFRQNVARELMSRGYTWLSGQELAAELATSADELQMFGRYWHDLPLDAHLPAGQRTRRRRFGYYNLTVTQQGLQLEHSQDQAYLQADEQHPFGGMRRTFEPLQPAFGTHPLVAGLIATDFRCIPVEISRSSRQWLVDVHQIRVVAQPRGTAMPTPEGIHRDVETIGVSHLIARHGIVGGEFEIYRDGIRQTAWQQSATLDTAMFVDAEVMHGVVPIACSSEGIGYRDVLLIGFTVGAPPARA